jgi:glycosyltransferase involved in cell wall biosynthesis
MNILFVHSIGKMKFGGGEKWVITAAAGLRDMGHKVFIGGREGSRLLRAASLNGLETINFNIYSDISIYYAFRIASFLKTHKIDVIITKGKDLAVTGIAAKMGGGPLVLVRHGLPLRSSVNKHSFLLKNLAHGIITNTRSIKELYEMRGWVKRDFTRVIYNGTSAPNNVPSFNFSAMFPGKKIILSVGRLAAQKGFFHLIDSINLLSRDKDNFVFFVLGEGKLHKKLLTYARKAGVYDRIHFEGYVENVVPFLKGCDIFVLPSLYEGMSNAAMEAMAYGKPVIMTNVDGAMELIPDQGKGILIPSGDPVAIADAVKRLMDDGELCARLGEEAKNHVTANFPVSAMITNIQSYIDEMILTKKSLPQISGQDQ